MVMPHGISTSFCWSTHVRPRHTGLGAVVVDTDARSPLATIAVLVTGSCTGPLRCSWRRTHRARVRVAVSLTLARLTHAEIVHALSTQRPTGLIPAWDPGHAGARQADAELVLSNDTDEGRRVVKVEIRNVALSIRPTALGAAALLAGNHPLHADRILVPAVRVSLTLRTDTQVVVRDLVAGKHHAHFFDQDGIAVVERHLRTRCLSSDIFFGELFAFRSVLFLNTGGEDETATQDGDEGGRKKSAAAFHLLNIVDV